MVWGIWLQAISYEIWTASSDMKLNVRSEKLGSHAFLKLGRRLWQSLLYKYMVYDVKRISVEKAQKKIHGTAPGIMT